MTKNFFYLIEKSLRLRRSRRLKTFYREKHERPHQHQRQILLSPTVSRRTHTHTHTHIYIYVYVYIMYNICLIYGALTFVAIGTRRTSRPRSVIPTNLVVEVMKSKPTLRRRDSVVVEVKSKSRRDSISPTLGASGIVTYRMNVYQC